MSLPVRMPDCPANPSHGQMHLRPIERQTPEQRWCGTWYDCHRCWSSRLIHSTELRQSLMEQRARIASSKAQTELLL